MRYEKPLLEKLVLESNSYSEVAKKLGLNHKFYGNRQTVKKYIDLFGINAKHFGNYGCGSTVETKALTLEEILVENSTYRDTRKIKEKLYKAGLKKRKCELCPQDEYWYGKKISLILDHINGVNNDHRLENLRIVCPNCNATLETHCKGYKGITYVKVNNKKHLSNDNHCGCGKLISNNSKNCKTCDEVKQRKVERPSLEQILLEIKELGYVGTGKKYGVSDNAIRNWVKDK
jgi:hypothetical protein